MAQSNQISNISHTHDQIMNWLIANPEKSNRDCARYFGYSESWISILIHSDVFQAKFKERQDHVFTAVMQDTPAKLKGLADIVVEQLGEVLEKNTDKDFTLDAFDKIMHRAGYAPASQKNPQGQAVTNNNLFMVSSDVLRAARATMAPQQLELNHEPEAVIGMTIEQEEANIESLPNV